MHQPLFHSPGLARVGVSRDEALARREEVHDPESMVYARPSDFTEYAIRVVDQKANKVVPFSYKERRYLRRIYDTGAKRVLLKCGRQVEKTLHKCSVVTTVSGAPKTMEDIEVGDRVIGLAPDGAHTATGEVTWKSEEYSKPCVRMRTRQGHEIIIALTHPMRTWGSWTEGSDLRVGTRLAVARQAGFFTCRGGSVLKDEWVALAGAMIAEGGCGGSSSPNFTQNEGALLDDVLDACVQLEIPYNPHEKTDSDGSWVLTFVQPEPGVDNPVTTKLKQWGLYGTTSHTKFVPDFVYELSPGQTALFLNRLWAGDGHCSLQDSSYHIEYDTVSERLARDVQRLLWKFGIPTSFRRWKPKLYLGTDKWAYKLRVETQEGARRFVEHIGALSKTEHLPLLGVDENSNRDTYPMEIAEDIKAIHRSREGYARRGRWVPQPSLRSAGLREKPKYSPSKAKLREYVEFFRADARFDQEAVDELEAHLDTDLFWDEVVEYVEIGEQPCYDITVAATDSFIADGFITHNSTMLGNRMLSMCCLNTGFKCLYVSPTHSQTNTFSRDRLSDPITLSPILSSWTTTKLTDNIHLKKFINHSNITLRYAYHNADRTRGIPSDMVTIDELQDILMTNIPVIEETASHSPWGIFVYSGTPKTPDNPMEHYWVYYSRQNEWMVPCERHGLPRRPASWHWNILGERNIGKHGPICDKCGETIDPMHPKAHWRSLNPKPDIPEPFEGFRIPQLMVPWIGWTDILQKQKFYGRAQFYNEVLGLSYDSGTRPITRRHLRALCNPELSMSREGLEKVRENMGGARVFMGVDWTGGSNKSFTVATLGAYLPGSRKFTYFYVHRFEGQESEPETQLELLKQLIRNWNVDVVGVDFGGGYWPNNELIKTFGPQRVIKWQYSQPNEKWRWDAGQQRYMVNRTAVMTDFFNALKHADRQIFELPKWEEFREPYATDFTNIFSEYNESLRLDEYKLAPEMTDDTCHSALLCLLASTLRIPRLDIFAVQQET